QHLPVGERVLFGKLAPSYRNMLLCCDAFIGSTEFLAEKAAALGRRAFVIRNGLSDEYCELAETALERRRSKATSPKLRIGYLSGTRTHRRDFEIVAEPLIRLMHDYPQVSLVIC